MNYEQKYKEALERARQIQNTPYTAHWDIMKEVVEDIFPALAESEDERIRKALKEYFINSFQNNGVAAICGVHIKYILAWLEKQGEKKPVDKVESKFKVGDEIRTKNEESLTITRIDRWGYWSEDLFICSFDDAAKWELVEQKPAWSEEDENLFKCAIDAVKQESKVRADGCLDEEVGGMVTDWLKSLKDRYTWKPSEEQISCLYDAVARYNREGFSAATLTSLLEQLKKLREE